MAGNDIGIRLGVEGEQTFHKSLTAVNAQIKALGAEMKAISAEFASNAQSEEALAAKNELLGRSTEAAKNKITLLEGQLDRQKTKLAALGTQLDQVTAAEGKNSAAAQQAQNAYNQQAAIVARLEAQYQSTRAQLAGLRNEMEETGDAADDAGDSLAGDVLAGTAAWNLIRSAVQGVTAALQDAVRTGAEFDASVADIAATMGTTVEGIGELRGFALEMGATTAYTAAEAAQALNYMALASYDAQASMETLPNVLNLAAAGGIELAASSDMVTDAQSALGLSMEQTAVLVDEMAKTSTKTNTSVGQLGEAILTVGGTAKFMAGGTAELNQVLGLLADNSVKGAEGGTKLRNIILSLSSPTEKGAEALDRLGVSVFDAEGNMREFSEIFPEMNRALSQLTDQKQIEALGEIFNSRDIAAAQALLGTTVERWSELDTAIQEAAGSAEQMAKTRLDNLAGDVTLLKSAADGAKIALSDSLTPALRDAAQAGAGILSFAGKIINEVPLAGQAIAGLAAAGVTLGAGAVAAAAGVTSVSMAVTKLTAALATNPFGLLALGVGAVVTGLAAMSHAADEAGKKMTEAAREVEASRAAFEEQNRAADEQRKHTEDLAAQLEELAGIENRTAGEKARLLEVTEQLNTAVPGLGLEYDELTDSLNMTTEQIMALTRAQLDAEERQQAAASAVQAEREHAQALRELEQAQKELTAALEARDQALEEGAANELGAVARMDALYSAVSEAEEKVESWKQKVDGSQEIMTEAKERLEELSDAAQDAGDSLNGAAGEADAAAMSAEELSATLKASEETVLSLAGACDTLSDALKEQEKEGSLTLKTTQELIEAGYASAIAIDQETGAVTLNREEYVRLAGAKIQEQLATLEAKQASIEAQRALLEEQLAAKEAALGYTDLAKQKALAAYADDAKALELQIAALNRAMGALNSYSGTVSTTARRSSSASKQVKTQAQKDLETYKSLKADLDHEKNMGLIEEAKYYEKLGELRDKYLGDSANLSEYRKASETIYKAEQKSLEEQEKANKKALEEREKTEKEALEKREKLWITANSNILKLEEDFQSKLTARAQAIMDSYKLFDEVPKRQKVSGQKLLRNLEEQVKSMEQFYGNLDKLQARGVSKNLVDDIRQMGVSASDELEGLLSLTEKDLSKYAEIYGKKQALANDIAAEELEGLRKQTNEAILGQLDDVAELYDTNGPGLGLAFAGSLADGMLEGMPEVESMSRTLANAAMAVWESTYNRDVEAMMSTPKSKVTTEDIGTLLAEAVNGIHMDNGGNIPVIHLETKLNGRVLAEELVEPMRQVERERPEIRDDRHTSG